MIKPPASLQIHQDLQEMEVICEGLDVSQYDKEYQYIRRDLIQQILDHVGLITYEPLDQIIDEVIQYHGNK